MLKPLIIKPLWGGGSDYVEPHVVLVEETNSVSYKAVVPLPTKTINYITGYIDNTSWNLKADYPLASDLYVYDNCYGNTWLKKGEQIKSNLIPPLTTNVIIYGIGFTYEDARAGQQECEDDTYIYRVKNN